LIQEQNVKLPFLGSMSWDAARVCESTRWPKATIPHYS
jgi:hypothetical protein